MRNDNHKQRIIKALQRFMESQQPQKSKREKGGEKEEKMKGKYVLPTAIQKQFDRFLEILNELAVAKEDAAADKAADLCDEGARIAATLEQYSVDNATSWSKKRAELAEKARFFREASAAK
jgi:hypothetical protein